MDNFQKNYSDPEPHSNIKRTIPSNYRPITCLRTMWKILAAQIREGIYYSLLCGGLFPEEKKENKKNR